MRTLIADCETDGLLPDMTKLHMVQIGDADGDDVTIYCDTAPPGWIGCPVKPLTEGIARLRAAYRVVFHNGIKFDFHAVNRFFPGTIQRERLLDTLVMARLAQPDERSHTLKAWGERLKVHKGDYKGDFNTVDSELLYYSAQDIVVGRALWRKVKHVLGWGTSCQLEHDTAWAIAAQEANGVFFDVKAAEALYTELRGELTDIDSELQVSFPPIQRSKTWTPLVNRPTLGYRRGVPFTKVWMEPFNPSSRPNVAERLQLLGWKPKAVGDNGVPTVDEKTLAGLPYPQVKPLLRHFKLTKQIAQLSDGKTGWLKLVKDGKIYGRVNPNGARTSRMSHSSPNLAQVDSDPRMRRLFGPGPGRKQVGCDAEGVQARMLGHYLTRWDDGAYSHRLVTGTKEARTDGHSVNLKALIDHRLLPEVCWTDKAAFKIGREGAKTDLYALIFGAQDPKLGDTIKGIWRELRDHGIDQKLLGGNPKLPSKELGRLNRMALAKAMVGLDKLAAAITERAKAARFLRGLDGRQIPVPSVHSALNTLLQAGEAVVMKKALSLFMERHGAAHGVNWWLMLNIHDEVQLSAEDDGLGWPERLGQDFAECITKAGELLGVRCPLAGAFSVGDNWADCH